MNAGDILDTEASRHLNRAQQRALVLRHELKYLDTHHLETFIDGVEAREPPDYRECNGTVHPPLTQVTLKNNATSFDLGNVIFPDEKGGIYRAHLTVENGSFEVRTSDALPKRDDNLASIPIHSFIAMNILPLFQQKYKAIHQRMCKINDARQYAYSMLKQPKHRFSNGKTLARLNPVKNEQYGTGQTGINERKREGGELISRHPSNKRKRIGLAAIPDDAKAEAFTNISKDIKAELFNAVVKAAFPNFDNLMMASWNVVKIYTNVGSEFPSMHKAVTDLNSALIEFENAFAKPVPKAEPDEKAITIYETSLVNVPSKARSFQYSTDTQIHPIQKPENSISRPSHREHSLSNSQHQSASHSIQLARDNGVLIDLSPKPAQTSRLLDVHKYSQGYNSASPGRQVSASPNLTLGHLESQRSYAKPSYKTIDSFFKGNHGDTVSTRSSLERHVGHQPSGEQIRTSQQKKHHTVAALDDNQHSPMTSRLFVDRSSPSTTTRGVSHAEGNRADDKDELFEESCPVPVDELDRPTSQKRATSLEKSALRAPKRPTGSNLTAPEAPMIHNKKPANRVDQRNIS